MASLPEVHLLAGLNGAGKTTFARVLERDLPAVRFSLDEWMLRLHGLTFDNPRYPAHAAECRELSWSLAVQVLRAGSPVVLDWNQWSRARRAESVRRATAIGAACVLHYLQVPLDTAIDRAAQRSDPLSHRLDATHIQHLAHLFEPPDETEGFRLDLVPDPTDLPAPRGSTSTG